MSIVENSLFLGFFLRLWRTLAGAWGDSAVGRGLEALGQTLLRWARGSAVCRFLWREGTLPRAWRESRMRALFEFLLDLPCALAAWIYQAGKGIWDGSLLFRAVSAMGGATFLFLGLFLFGMLIAPHAVWNNLYGLLGTLALTVLFVIGAASRPKHRLEPSILGPYMLCYLICIGGAFVGSLSRSLSLRFFFFHITAFLIVLLAVSSVKKFSQLRLMVALAVAGITIASIYGCYQGYVGVEVVASQQDMNLNYGMPGRIYSFFDNPNNFAELLVMMIPLDMGIFLAAKTWRGKLWSLLALIPCVGSIGLTYSRSGWIGLALAVLVMIALENWRLVPAIALLGLCAIPFLPETIYNRILTIGNMKDTSTSYRFAIYEASANLMKDYWYPGVGLGSDVMNKAFHAYPTMFDGSWPIHTHNNYLQMWGETGIWGVLSYVALLAYGIKSGVKQFFRTADRDVRHILAGALGAFCGILVIGVAEYTWFYPRNMFIYWFLFGVIMACVKLGRTSAKRAAQ